MNILEVRNLTISFKTLRGDINVVKNLSLKVNKNEVVGIVGESGSGKSVTALAIMGLINGNHGKVSCGEILFNGQDLRKLDERQLCSIRGRHIAMVFQEPMSSLNPVITIYKQLKEVYKIHIRSKKNKCRQELIELLNALNIVDAEEVLDKYPFELSGGIKQRIIIAMALICKPDLIICDEPTTALDVTTQAEILKLLKKIKEEYDTSIIFITHDLGVIAEIAERVAVMYLGEIVEICRVKEFFDNPQHPYSKDLLLAKPENFDGRFKTINGMIPGIYEEIKGCSYYSRCKMKIELCENNEPKQISVGSHHKVRCFKCYNEENKL